jgi:uncharacterized protein YndB with AHSA1/START domain
MELTFELPGTPEQVWGAIATANGISSWFLPTDLEEGEGGAICTHMGEEVSSPGTVTGWDPPRRFAYEEPDWASLAGQDSRSVTPLATEFLVQARSGGTCVLRVVSSAFGTGADWEQEFFVEMERGWRPYFDNLRLYLTHFPGQRVTSLSAQATVPGDGDRVWSTMRGSLGVAEVGQQVEARGLTGRVERMGTAELLLRLTDPFPGFLQFTAYQQGEDSTWTQIEGYLFSEDAADYVEREQPAWKAWLQGLAVAAA